MSITGNSVTGKFHISLRKTVIQGQMVSVLKSPYNQHTVAIYSVTNYLVTYLTSLVQ